MLLAHLPSFLAYRARVHPLPTFILFYSLIMAYVMLIYSIVKAILSNVPRLSFCLCVSEWDLSSWIAFFDRGMIRGRISLLYGTSTGPFSIWVILSILKNGYEVKTNLFSEERENLLTMAW